MDSQFHLHDLDSEYDEKKLNNSFISHARNSLPWFQVTWIITLCIFNVVLIFPSLSDTALHRLDSNRMENGPDITTNFTQNQRLASIDHHNDYLWDEIAPTPGFALFKTSSTKNEWELGAYSMFHQLHCIRSVRKALQDSVAGKDIGIDHHDNIHWPHCMDYLVQSLLCHADDTIERGDTKDGITHNISGYQEVRQCKEKIKLYDNLVGAKQNWEDDSIHREWALRHCVSLDGLPPENACLPSDLS